MTTITRLDVRPISDVLGASITGIDLREEVPPETVAEIMDIWHRFQVIVFPGQDITEDEQVRFSSHFGTVWSRPEKTELFADQSNRLNRLDTMLISNIRENGVPIGQIPDGDMGLHSDKMYQAVVAKATLLYAIEVPSKGGETRFANMYKAYEALPQRIRDRLEGRYATNGYTYGQFISKGEKRTADGGTHSHPAVITHPETGRRALFVAPLMTRRIEGLEQAESDDLLAEINDVIERPEHIYEHFWTVGDLVIWDNRCVLHGRNDFSPDERRLLRRVATDAERPPVF